MLLHSSEGQSQVMSPAMGKMHILTQSMASAEHTPATVEREESDLNIEAWGLSAYVVP